MDSRTFIKAAGELIKKIEASKDNIDTADEIRNQRDNMQKEVTALFNGLMNPTLSSAFNLRDTALRSGFHIEPAVLNRLAKFE